jgi:hypothetical protein
LHHLAEIKLDPVDVVAPVLAKLSASCVQLPECLRVIGYLRRLAVFSEHDMRLQVTDPNSALMGLAVIHDVQSVLDVRDSLSLLPSTDQMLIIWWTFSVAGIPLLTSLSDVAPPGFVCSIHPGKRLF